MKRIMWMALLIVGICVCGSLLVAEIVDGQRLKLELHCLQTYDIRAKSWFGELNCPKYLREVLIEVRISEPEIELFFLQRYGEAI